MSDATEQPGAARSPARARGRRGRPSKARGRPNSSDLASARWTVRGVPAPVRDMALRAADARGMTVGDWVAEAIITVARAADKAEGNKLPAREPPPDLTTMLQSIEGRLRQLEQRQQVGFFGRLFSRRA
ncbi:MAG: hypothetical protein ACREJ0_05555 [Geminicoccaceae bacterium]